MTFTVQSSTSGRVWPMTSVSRPARAARSTQSITSSRRSSRRSKGKSPAARWGLVSSGERNDVLSRAELDVRARLVHDERLEAGAGGPLDAIHHVVAQVVAPP